MVDFQQFPATGQAAAATLQISWVYSEDLVRSEWFYAELLGLRLLRRESGARIYRTTAGAAIGVCQVFEDRVVEPRGCMISLVTSDVDGWYQRLNSAGARTRGEPHWLERFGIYTFFAEDPDGYIIEFQQFLDREPHRQ